MRRFGSCLAAVSVVFVSTAGVATATPTVTLKAALGGLKPRKHVFGAPATAEYQLSIRSNEYDGAPPPLERVVLGLPMGLVVNDAGFTSCSEETLRDDGPSACPKGSAIGPTGSAQAWVSFGGERVPEALDVESYNDEGHVNVLLEGHSPVLVEAVATGIYPHLKPTPELSIAVPPEETVPGAPLLSLEALSLKLGALLKHKKEIHSYFTGPAKCPASGTVTFTAALTFAAFSGNAQQTVTRSYAQTCPKE